MKLLLLVALAAHTAGLGAQMIAPGRRLNLTDSASAQLDSMAHRTLRSRVEQAMCVTTYAVDDSLLVLINLAPAKNVSHADSVSMGFSGPQAEPWQPCIHSHLPLDGYQYGTPSMTDVHFAAVRGVFGFLMIVKPDTSWILKPYP